MRRNWSGIIIHRGLNIDNTRCLVVRSQTTAGEGAQITWITSLDLSPFVFQQAASPEEIQCLLQRGSLCLQQNIFSWLKETLSLAVSLCWRNRGGRVLNLERRTSKKTRGFKLFSPFPESPVLAAQTQPVNLSVMARICSFAGVCPMSIVNCWNGKYTSSSGILSYFLFFS